MPFMRLGRITLLELDLTKVRLVHVFLDSFMFTFTMAEDEGFRGFVNKLDPAYVLPTRQVFSICHY